MKNGYALPQVNAFLSIRGRNPVPGIVEDKEEIAEFH